MFGRQSNTEEQIVKISQSLVHAPTRAGEVSIGSRVSKQHVQSQGAKLEAEKPELCKAGADIPNTTESLFKMSLPYFIQLFFFTKALMFFLPVLVFISARI